MTAILGFLCLVIPIALILGIIKPSIVIWWGDPEKKTRGKVIKYYGLGLVATIILLGIFGSNNDTTPTTSNKSTNQEDINNKNSTTKSTTSKDTHKDNSKDTSKIDLIKNVIENLQPIDGGKKPEMSDTTYDFLVSNLDLFPATTQQSKTKLNSLIDYNIKAKHLEKNIADYQNKIMSDTADVIQVEEDKDDNNNVVTFLNVSNDNEDTYHLIYVGKIDIFKGDKIKFIGTPTDVYSYATTNGGFANAYIVSTANIEKIETPTQSNATENFDNN